MVCLLLQGERRKEVRLGAVSNQASLGSLSSPVLLLQAKVGQAHEEHLAGKPWRCCCPPCLPQSNALGLMDFPPLREVLLVFIILLGAGSWKDQRGGGFSEPGGEDVVNAENIQVHLQLEGRPDPSPRWWVTQVLEELQRWLQPHPYQRIHHGKRPIFYEKNFGRATRS